jgi:hypothetical protein
MLHNTITPRWDIALEEHYPIARRGIQIESPSVGTSTNMKPEFNQIPGRYAREQQIDVACNPNRSAA